MDRVSLTEGLPREEINGLALRALHRMTDALPEAERPAAIRRLQAILADLHREAGAEPPEWTRLLVE